MDYFLVKIRLKTNKNSKRVIGRTIFIAKSATEAYCKAKWIAKIRYSSKHTRIYIEQIPIEKYLLFSTKNIYSNYFSPKKSTHIKEEKNIIGAKKRNKEFIDYKIKKQNLLNNEAKQQITAYKLSLVY